MKIYFIYNISTINFLVLFIWLNSLDISFFLKFSQGLWLCCLFLIFHVVTEIPSSRCRSSRVVERNWEDRDFVDSLIGMNILWAHVKIVKFSFYVIVI